MKSILKKSQSNAVLMDTVFFKVQTNEQSQQIYPIKPIKSIILNLASMWVSSFIDWRISSITLEFSLSIIIEWFSEINFYWVTTQGNYITNQSKSKKDVNLFIIQSNLSKMATLGTEESGRCVEVVVMHMGR